MARVNTLRIDRDDCPVEATVPTENVEEVVDGREREITRHEPTLGRGRGPTLEPIEWVPLAGRGEFLVTRTDEMRAEDSEDVDQLYELPSHVRRTDRAPSSR